MGKYMFKWVLSLKVNDFRLETNLNAINFLLIVFIIESFNQMIHF
jgi:hypothetical protein